MDGSGFVPGLILGFLLAGILALTVEDRVRPNQWNAALERCQNFGGVGYVEGTAVTATAHYVCADGSSGEVETTPEQP